MNQVLRFFAVLLLTLGAVRLPLKAEAKKPPRPVLHDLTGAPTGDLRRISMSDYMTDPGIQAIYKECSQKGWIIVARLGVVKQAGAVPDQSVIYLFVWDSTLDIRIVYFKTIQKHFVVLISFPNTTIDRALSDFFKK